MSQAQAAIWWVRRDLRLGDNPALVSALAQSETVIPLFILDPRLLNAPAHRSAHKRLAFLFDGLRRLDEDLRARGSRLIVRRGQPLSVLKQVHAETKAAVILAAEDFGPYARRRDALVAGGLPLTLMDGQVVQHPTAVVKDDGRPYSVFTPFKRAWQALPSPTMHDLLPAPAQLKSPPDMASEALPDAAGASHFSPGETIARETLRRFLQSAVFNYSAGRNRLDRDGTSSLSPYLRFGMLSAREAVLAARDAILTAPHFDGRQGAEAWFNELIWREFYIAILHHFPEVLRHAFRPALPDIAWVDNEAGYAAWREGQTGYPVVDAAMRQLTQTGWMHNRARMITASFLVKDLLIDWRLGEQWFMQHLVDGDPAANNGGWQWVAGVGTDAAPYFRLFSPVRQSQAFDPHGDFARAWLPELRHVPDAYIHTPWTMPADIQRQAHCRIGKDYPMPIVDHAAARQRALAAYRAQRPARG